MSFFERFKTLCEKGNTNVTTVTRELGYSTGSMSQWKSGSMPRGDVIANVANYFGVSTDYLLMQAWEEELLKKGVVDYFEALDPSGVGSEAILTRINALTGTPFTIERINEIRHGKDRPTYKEFWRMLNLFDYTGKKLPPPTCNQLLGLLYNLDLRQEKSDPEDLGTTFDITLDTKLDEMSAASEKSARKQLF